jgi:hypothetical protein
MSVYSWPKDPVEVVIEYGRRSAAPGIRAEPEALIMWAAWTVDSLYYLEEIVEADRTGPDFYAPHNPATKAIAHLRWAAGSSLTAIDLCAAAIARELKIKTGSKEFDARLLDRHRGNLTAPFITWFDNLITDGDYGIVLQARHPSTHGRLIRHFEMSNPSIWIDIDGTRFTTDDLIRVARSFATRHVESFLGIIETV